MKQFSLIKNEEGINEKRVLPRFPFCYFIFKTMRDQARGESKTFEVKDISVTGMQLAIIDGKHDFHKSSTFYGTIHWGNQELEVHGSVVWATPSRVGVEFDRGTKLVAGLKNFLSLDNIMPNLRPLHAPDYALELPGNLKYWLRADGPLELFLWKHSHGEYSKFQMIILENFIEWEDGHGLKTGRLLSKRDVDTPLITEDEFIFSIDNTVNKNTENLGLEFIKRIPEEFLSKECIEFIKFKLNL
ncbi:MAG: PilZ domain-containing protein [Bacteriovoracaceae bacterium]|nr:PilZ domain-containing protein [Bacteriovoracaceae bacterium]